MDRSAQEALLLQEYKHHIINGVGYQSPLSKEGSRSAAQWLLTMFEPFFSKTQQKNLQKIESKGISSTKEYLQLDALRASITAEVLKQIGVEADQVAFRVQVLEHSIGYPTPRYKAEFNKSASWILSQCDGYIDAQDQATKPVRTLACIVCSVRRVRVNPDGFITTVGNPVWVTSGRYV